MWRSNGSSTKLVKDINPGVADGNPNSGIIFNGLFYFIADDGVNGMELWSSNGLPSGTLLFKDINPGAGSGCSEYSDLYVFNGTFISMLQMVSMEESFGSLMAHQPVR